MTKSILASFLLLSLQTVALTATAEPTGEWQFRALLDGSDIGRHSFRVSADGEQIRVESDASFRVRFLFFDVFRYEHHATELWSGGCLQTISASTRKNGSVTSVNGRQEGDAFVLESGDGNRHLSGCVSSFAYWNPDILLASQLLNSQTGQYQAVAVASAGESALIIEDESVLARAYTLTVAEQVLTLWYGAQDGRWLALEAPAEGGRTLRYELLEAPRPANGDKTETRNEMD